MKLYPKIILNFSYNQFCISILSSYPPTTATAFLTLQQLIIMDELQLTENGGAGIKHFPRLKLSSA